MKASELIELLKERIAASGDRQVVFAHYDSYDGVNLNGISVEDVSTEDNEGKPVFALWDY